MHWIIRLFLLIMPMIITSNAVAVSPWMLSEKDLYYSGGLNYSTNDKSWDESSHLQDSSCTSNNYRSNQRLEYGYSYYHTLIADLDIVKNNCGNDSYTGLGDLRLGIRGRLNVFRNGRTWELTAIIPTGYSSNDPERPGNGKFGIEGGVAYLSRGEERDVAKRWDFLTGASVRLWAGGPADQFLTYATVRRHFGKNGRLSIGVSGDFSFQNESGTTAANTPGQTQFSDFDKVTAKVSWSNRLNDDWRYRVGASHVVWGRNAGHNLKFGITFSRHWRL